MRRSPWIVATLLMLALGTALPARAEVSAETDTTGAYVRTIVLTNASVKNLKIWSRQRSNGSVYPLNEMGDLNGDLYPEIAENPHDRNHPWVLWSRFNGVDYDIAWSRWKRTGWTGVAWLTTEPCPGDDLGPDVDYDAYGRAHATWWRAEGGIGRVYFSLFLETRWMAPYLVTDPEVDSRNPTIHVISDTEIAVQFDTPDGRMQRIITFNRPVTITDDIDPFSQFEVGLSDPVSKKGESYSN